MPLKNGPLSRRTLLRGAGAAMALPWLEAMLPTSRCAQAAAAPNAPGGPPVRMAFLYMPNGAHPAAWTPEGEGPNFKFSPLLSPLAGMKNDILVLSQLSSRSAFQGDGHYAKIGAMLTGATARRTSGRDLYCGISVDQYAAQAIGNRTPLPSLELGIDPVRNNADLGYSSVYGCHVSWRSATEPLAKEINPRLAFDRLFRANRQSENTDDKSVLDLVRDDARGLRDRLGGRDRQKLDEYLQSVRELEQRIELAFDNRQQAQLNPQAPQGPNAKNLTRPAAETPANAGIHIWMMLDILALAFWTDATRLGTFMFGNEVSLRNYEFAGIPANHHDVSHHNGDATKLEAYKRISNWHVSRFAYFLERLRSFKEGEGNVLDNSMIVFCSGMSDGNSHNPHNLPLVLAGRGGGRLQPGRHLKFPTDTPVCNLYLTLLDCLGVPTEHFGDSTGKLPGLTV